MFPRVTILVLFLLYFQCGSTFDSRNVVFVIVSQTEAYHASVAARLKKDIETQVLDIEKRYPKVHVTHEDYPVPGSWTIIPLLRPLVLKYKGSDVRWVVFLEPHTAVRCKKLFETLSAADKQEDIMWIGYPLSDEEPTIIHHFIFYEELEEEGGFIYPNFASGFAMRIDLMNTTTNERLMNKRDLACALKTMCSISSQFRLIAQIKSGRCKLKADFSIDPAFELAQLVYGGSTDPGPLLTGDLSFCVVSGDNCATYPRQFDICGSPVSEESIYFAVKTWSGFHSTRARVVKKTWGKYVTNIMFYSDKADPSLPAVETGVANTKSGHCAKTMAILKMAVDRVKDAPHIKWIFLADDDTILGVHRLTEVLSCYRGGSDFTVLGERYGYGYSNTHPTTKGYDYITGGGGCALSVAAARALRLCACAEPAAPDDMALGACSRALNHTLTHLPLFHQGRPQDYPREVVARDRPVSFHRHSSPEPLRVYGTWFQHEDMAIKRRPLKDEL